MPATPTPATPLLHAVSSRRVRELLVPSLTYRWSAGRANVASTSTQSSPTKAARDSKEGADIRVQQHRPLQPLRPLPPNPSPQAHTHCFPTSRPGSSTDHEASSSTSTQRARHQDVGGTRAFSPSCRASSSRCMDAVQTAQTQLQSPQSSPRGIGHTAIQCPSVLADLGWGEAQHDVYGEDPFGWGFGLSSDGE